MEQLATEKEVLRCYETAGRVAHLALLHGARQIKPDVNMREVLDSVEEFILKHKCGLAFPAQSSLGSMAAHFCPTDLDNVMYKEGDLVKLDCGAHCEGFIGDNAITISIGGEHDDLANAALAALRSAQGVLRPGCTPDAVGRTIQDTLATKGFLPIRNLSGHGLGKFNIHTSPSMPNYPSGEKIPLVEGQVVAVEPFATNGTAGMIYNGTTPTIFSLCVKRPLRTEYGRAAYSLVNSYGGLPFTTRWLTRSLGAKGLLGLSELRRSRMLVEYPPLLERSGGLVAQQENTFLITRDGCRVLTTDD